MRADTLELLGEHFERELREEGEECGKRWSHLVSRKVSGSSHSLRGATVEQRERKRQQSL